MQLEGKPKLPKRLAGQDIIDALDFYIRPVAGQDIINALDFYIRPVGGWGFDMVTLFVS